ncbi:hypothetical protein [Nesterenkonia aerolata]|uniref:Fibronectin attachment protein n=1 Tax=Nesterenkonia aerolata TaxID=3074079 RepID=A0ABU2DNU3_9MICC|nr:hypothetical protein [Nesterenkonia sp. LY-0111]MDR8018187.1 hypothetical protein [Nesterenkonia sp. LY-0111]
MSSRRVLASGGPAARERASEPRVAIPAATRAPRSGRFVVLSLLTAVLGLMAVLITAWIIGGRAVAPASAEDLLDEPSSSDGQIPLDELEDLAPLGWNVAQLGQDGFGFTPESARTDVTEGVRTVTVQFTQGDRRLVVAESRPEDPQAQLPSARDRLETGRLLDEQPPPQTSAGTDPMVLVGGESAQMHHVPGESTWSAVAGDDDVQYLITSDADPSEARPITSWVMLSDRARVTGTPDAPSGVDRIQEGFSKLFTRLP